MKQAKKDLQLFQMRYKKNYGIAFGFIEASTIEVAEKLGREYCQARPGHLYLSIEDPILVRESDEPEVSEKERKTA
jgi:hypothetical protein